SRRLAQRRISTSCVSAASGVDSRLVEILHSSFRMIDTVTGSTHPRQLLCGPPTGAASRRTPAGEAAAVRKRRQPEAYVADPFAQVGALLWRPVRRPGLEQAEGFTEGRGG